MTAKEFRLARKQYGWTQVKMAERLGLSQPYLALLENGKRQVGPKLLKKLAGVLKLRPTVLPLPDFLQTKVSPKSLAQQFAALGYPGFAYMRGAPRRNPAEVLLTALAQDNLESRLTEALPWVLLHYPEMNPDWLRDQARLRNLSNRLGFIVSLAKGAAGKMGDTNSTRYRCLDHLETQLRESRLDKEDTLCQESLSDREREWLLETRPTDADYWHVLTDWRPEHLQYADVA